MHKKYRVTLTLALLAVAEGQSYTRAAQLVGHHTGDTVARWVAGFNRAGLAAVVPRHGGGHPVCYGEAEQRRILAEVARAPERVRDATATWSLTTLRNALRRAEDGLPGISTYTIGRAEDGLPGISTYTIGRAEDGLPGISTYTIGRAEDGLPGISTYTIGRAEDGLPGISTYTIGRTLHAAGLSWQKGRSWCEAGVVVRKRKHEGLVTVIDPDAAAKRG